MKNNNTSLARSHSTSSNFLLTLRCIVAALLFSGGFVAISLSYHFQDAFSSVLLIVGVALFPLSILLVLTFHR